MERSKKKNNVGLGRKLYRFIWNEKQKEVKLLVANPNCDVNWVANGNWWTSLIMASRFGYFYAVRVLLGRQNLLINRQDIYGDSALIWASIEENTICVELLLDDPRTDVNLVNKSEHSALWFAYKYNNTPIMKLLISHGANVEGVAESVLEYQKGESYVHLKVSVEATEVMENWKLYLPEFTRFAKTNKYYPTEFKKWAFNFILCCLRSRSFPKDIIHLLLEYIARAWKINEKCG